jgi:hypothetical protein
MFRINDAPEWPEWLAEWSLSEILYRQQRAILTSAFWVAMDDMFDPAYINWKYRDGEVAVDVMYMPHQATVDAGITGMCDETRGAWEDFFGAAIRFTLGQDGQIVMREAEGVPRVDDAVRMIGLHPYFYAAVDWADLAQRLATWQPSHTVAAPEYAPAGGGKATRRYAVTFTRELSPAC